MFESVGSGEAKVTTAQMALTIAIVGEACFIAGFIAGTRRTTRRFKDYVKRRGAHRAVQASRYAVPERRRNDEQRSVLPDVVAPHGAYSLRGTPYEEDGSRR